MFSSVNIESNFKGIQVMIVLMEEMIIMKNFEMSVIFSLFYCRFIGDDSGWDFIFLNLFRC